MGSPLVANVIWFSAEAKLERDTPTTPQGRYAGQLLTVKEVSAILRISEATVRDWVNDGRLVGGTIGMKIYRIQVLA